MVTKDDFAAQVTTSLGINNDDVSDDESDISDISDNKFQFSIPLADYQSSSSLVLHSDYSDNDNRRDQNIDLFTGTRTMISNDVASESIHNSSLQVDDIGFTRNVMKEVLSKCDEEKLGTLSSLPFKVELHVINNLYTILVLCSTSRILYRTARLR